MSDAPICVACGVQSREAFARCPICADDRVGAVWPQAWTTSGELRRRHRIVRRELAPGVTSLQCEPQISVGHHAVLVRTAHGNVLWDCLPFVDDATVSEVNALGGLRAIALSHPHFYGAMVDWSHAFGGVPVYVHTDDRHWVQRPDPVVTFWEGATERLDDDATLVRCGGHFAGSAVLHSS
ncbi:MAG: MBL fold metallo-hydrolase, partial [Candidatus Rokuibacteriota bacterium]